MSPIAVEMLIIAGLVLLNGLLALAEIAIVASRVPRLQRLAEQGNARAEAALALVGSPADFLSTVQVGITLVGVLSGAFAGATIAEQLAVVLAATPIVGPYAESAAIAVVVVAITFLALIFGELVPKRIALNDPERIGSLVARPMRTLSRFTKPVVRLLSISSDAVLWLLRVKPSAAPSVTEEEVRIMVRQGATAGVFAKDQQEMIDRVFRLGSLNLRAIMTARSDIVPLYITDPAEVVTGKVKAATHGYYPLCDGSLDNVVGVVSTTGMLLQSLSSGRFDLRAAATEVPNIPESVSALKALEFLRKAGARVGLVIDEYGGLQGMVTMSDFGGALVGMLEKEGSTRIVRRKDGSLLVDGLVPIADLRREVDLPEGPPKESHRYSTVAGFVLARMGRIPSAGDRFLEGGLRFEIVEMDGKRIDRVLITREAAE